MSKMSVYEEGFALSEAFLNTVLAEITQSSSMKLPHYLLFYQSQNEHTALL
jgi:hypothetical protein